MPAAGAARDNVTGFYCVGVSDNITYWPETEAGHRAVVPCPTHFEELQLTGGQNNMLIIIITLLFIDYAEAAYMQT